MSDIGVIHIQDTGDDKRQRCNKASLFQVILISMYKIFYHVSPATENHLHTGIVKCGGGGGYCDDGEASYYPEHAYDDDIPDVCDKTKKGAFQLEHNSFLLP